MRNIFTNRFFTTQILALALLGGTTNIAMSEEEGSFEKEIEYRQGVMNILSWNTKNISGMLKDKMPYDAEKVKTHAKDIASVSTLDILAGFPEDSESENSDALADIWMEFENFEKKLADFRKAASGINEAAQSGDKTAVANAMKELGQSCKGCHKKYKN